MQEAGSLTFGSSCTIKIENQGKGVLGMIQAFYLGRRSLVGCSLWGREESDTTEQLHFHFTDYRVPSTSLFPGGSEVKASTCNVGDPGLIPGSGRSPGEGNGKPLQYSRLENPMDGGAWRTTVHRVAKSRTRLSDFTFFHGICSFKTGNI